MRDADCVRFLQWALPRLGFRWAGFRRVRRQVCRRLRGRLRELGLADLTAYRELLECDAGEWDRLAPLCRVTISRFYRDREVFRALGEVVLPELARATGGRLEAWSAGCGAGEEAYSLALAARRGAGLEAADLRIVGTDWDPRQLERARRAVYPASSLRDLPDGWRDAFEPAGEEGWRLRPGERRGVVFVEADLRRRAPEGWFDLVLCRNSAFTYFDARLQRQVLERIRSRLRPGGALAIGSHEELPGDGPGLTPWPRVRGLFRRQG